MLAPVGGTAGERSASGLLEWETANDAMEALAMMNHYQMKNPSKWRMLYELPVCKSSQDVSITCFLFLPQLGLTHTHSNCVFQLRNTQTEPEMTTNL